MAATDDSLDLLKKLQSLVEVGRQLTYAMEKAEPYLSHPPPTATASRMWVRPLPTSMEQVDQVLAVARHLAARTSAPAGWNPNAPVIGFTTPNPLPHQLRGGALGALQLDRARQLERDRKRQRLQKAAREADKAKGIDQDINNPQEGDDHEDDETSDALAEAMRDPKRRELAERQQERLRQQAPHRGQQRQPATQQQQQQQPLKVVATTMNLSESSSSEDEDDDD